MHEVVTNSVHGRARAVSTSIKERQNIVYAMRTAPASPSRIVEENADLQALLLVPAVKLTRISGVAAEVLHGFQARRRLLEDQISLARKLNREAWW
jgi:hypothetical protein